MIGIILLMGFLFGTALQYAKVNRYDTISAMAVLDDYTVAKTIATAIGVGAILFTIETELGLATFHIKSLIIQNMVIGGLTFGIGMAILGYCPGTLPVSLGQGSVDALFGILGGFTAGAVYPLVSPYITDIAGSTDMGKISLASAVGEGRILYYILILIIGGAFIALSFLINKMEKKRNLRWFYSGSAIAILACFVFASSLTDRPLGVSSFYSYFIESVRGVTGYSYLSSDGYTPGDWHMNFLVGAFLSGLVISLLRKEFRLVIIHKNWSRLRGDSVPARLAWAFFGGFLLLFGARMAGGCTSGHIISGGMQMAASSYLFAVFVFCGFLITGRFFYKRR